MKDQKKIIALAAARLDAIKSSIVPGAVVERAIVKDFHNVIDQIDDIYPEDDVLEYQVPSEAINRESGWVRYPVFNGKLLQAIAFLKHAAPAEDDAKLIRAGTLYTSIADTELRARCADLISGTAHFDRAINQATLVLEDRIRRKSGPAGVGLTGTELVNRTIKAEPGESVLILSQDQGEQAGMSNMCRGVMLAYRNETHHYLTDRYSREDALKVCAFIDLLLRAVDGATVRA